VSGNSISKVNIVADKLALSGNATFNDLTAPSGSIAYSPAQLRDAYGVNGVTFDGTGQVIAIVDAYDNPNIYQALDQFDGQFGATATGANLYDQYGPASAFLTVLNQGGQSTPLPATDPSGPGVANWESESALDVEWTHAMAPGAQIVLVEASSQSLADLMASA
jgi:subtilase family serine protease